MIQMETMELHFKRKFIILAILFSANTISIKVIWKKFILNEFFSEGEIH